MQHAPLHVERGTFRDAESREIILRGVNISGNAKVPPFRPIDRATQLDPLPGMGVNVVRLLFNWEAFEPNRRAYDDTYLAYIAQVIAWAWDRHIYTIVDFHQDALARVLLRGCGEGFPPWVIPQTLTRYPPDNSERCAKWYAMMWIDRDMGRAWRAFYANDNNMREDFLAMVDRVARALRDTPGVIGYDLLNEPRGDELDDIAPFYHEAGSRIRAADPPAMLFVEPHVRVDIGFDTHLPKPDFGNVVYAPHFYDGPTTLFNAYLVLLRYPFDKMRTKARAWDAPLFVGEFGVPPTTRNAPGYIGHMLDSMDTMHASGAQWSYTPGWHPSTKDGWNHEDLSIVDDAGALRANFEPRPYAQKIAGDLDIMTLVTPR